MPNAVQHSDRLPQPPHSCKAMSGVGSAIAFLVAVVVLEHGRLASRARQALHSNQVCEHPSARANPRAEKNKDDAKREQQHEFGSSTDTTVSQHTTSIKRRICKYLGETRTATKIDTVGKSTSQTTVTRTHPQAIVRK